MLIDLDERGCGLLAFSCSCSKDAQRGKIERTVLHRLGRGLVAFLGCHGLLGGLAWDSRPRGTHP